MQTKPKHVTIQMKDLDECIVMVTFLLLLKRVQLLEFLKLIDYLGRKWQ